MIYAPLTMKLADLAHNSGQSRFVGSGLTEEKFAYWREKDCRAKEILCE